MSSLVKNTTEGARVIEENDKEFVTDKTLSDAEKFERDSVIKQIYEIRQDPKAEVSIIDPRDVPKNMKYETGISTLTIPQLRDENLTTYNFIRLAEL